MLTAVREQAARHGRNPHTRPTPVLDKITAAGSLAVAPATGPTVATVYLAGLQLAAIFIWSAR